MKYSVTTLLAATLIAASTGIASAEDSDGFGIHYPNKLTSSQSTAQQPYNLTPKAVSSEKKDVQFGIQSPESEDILRTGQDG